MHAIFFLAISTTLSKSMYLKALAIATANVRTDLKGEVDYMTTCLFIL